MIIGITGTNGAGKGVVVDYLVDKKGFTHFSNSGFLTEELTRRGLELIRPNLRLVGNEFREKYGSGYLAETALATAKANSVTHLVVEAIRSSGEADKIKEAGGVLVVVDADRPLRYKRIYARRSGKDLIDFDTFVEQEEREWYGAEGSHDMNVRVVMDRADYTILNNGSLQELYTQIDAMLKEFQK